MASRTFLAFGCTHLPLHCEAFRQHRLKKIAEIQPDYGIDLGDHIDYTALCKHPTGERHDLVYEFEQLAKDYDDIKAASPSSALVYLLGNHEERFLRPEVPEQLRALYDFRRHESWSRHRNDVSVIQYGARQGFRLGPILFSHGSMVGINADRQEAMLYAPYYGLRIGAHTHVPIEPTRVTLPGRTPVPKWYCNVGTGADWDNLYYVNNSNIQTWGSALVWGVVHTDKPRRYYDRKEWEVEFELVKTVAGY